MSLNGVFSIGLSGINALSTSFEAISNNVANSQTTGYRRLETDFSTLVSAPAPELDTRVGTPRAGGGVSAINRAAISQQGAVTRTGAETNLAINGDGFFVVSRDAAEVDAINPFLFTRAGGFRADADGNLVNEAGYFLQGSIAGASGAATSTSLGGLRTVNIADIGLTGGAAIADIEITDDGQVIARLANGDTRALFDIPLAVFTNPDGLDDAPLSAFRRSEDSGEATFVRSGQDGAGTIESAALELSTVDISQEFSTLIVTQRAYASNSQIISIADELLQTLTETAA